MQINAMTTHSVKLSWSSDAGGCISFFFFFFLMTAVVTTIYDTSAACIWNTDEAPYL